MAKKFKVFKIQEKFFKKDASLLHLIFKNDFI